MSETNGSKLDDSKTRWDLLLVMLNHQTEQVVQGLMYGATKYKENPDDPNYRKIKDAKRRTLNAAIRHIVADFNGERIDKESGIPHLALAVDEILFAMWHNDNKQER